MTWFLASQNAVESTNVSSAADDNWCALCIIGVRRATVNGSVAWRHMHPHQHVATLLSNTSHIPSPCLLSTVSTSMILLTVWGLQLHQHELSLQNTPDQHQDPVGCCATQQQLQLSWSSSQTAVEQQNRTCVMKVLLHLATSGYAQTSQSLLMACCHRPSDTCCVTCCWLPWSETMSQKKN